MACRARLPGSCRPGAGHLQRKRLYTARESRPEGKPIRRHCPNGKGRAAKGRPSGHRAWAPL